MLSHVWLCNSMHCSPPDSSLQGTLKTRILEWVATSFSRGSSWPTAGTRVLLHCRQTLYHLSFQGSPLFPMKYNANIHKYYIKSSASKWQIQILLFRNFWKFFPQNGFESRLTFQMQNLRVQSESVSHCHVLLFTTPRTAAHQAPLSMEFSRQEYWSGLPSPSLSFLYPTKDWTWVSGNAGRFFTVWATRQVWQQLQCALDKTFLRNL